MSSEHPGAGKYCIVACDEDQQIFKNGDIIRTIPLAVGNRHKILHVDSYEEKVLSEEADQTMSPVRRLADVNGKVALTFLPRNPPFDGIVIGQVRHGTTGPGGMGGTAVFVAEDDSGRGKKRDQ